MKIFHFITKQTKINTELLKAPRKLTDKEFKEIQRHTIIGYTILKNCKFGSPEIKLAALQHHERIDGSGYPKKITRIDKVAQFLGFVDCYEALTNDDRPYRTAMDPFNALVLIKKDVEAKKFDRNIFETFTKCLAQ